MGELKCSVWAMSRFIQFKVEAAPLIYVIGMTQVRIVGIIPVVQVDHFNAITRDQLCDGLIVQLVNAAKMLALHICIYLCALFAD